MIKAFNKITETTFTLLRSSDAEGISDIGSSSICKWVEGGVGEDESWIVVDVHAVANVGRDIVGKIAGIMKGIGKLTGICIVLVVV